MGGSRSAAPMAMSPSLTKGMIASNACSGPFPLLSRRVWGSGNGPVLAGKLGGGGALARRAGSGMIASNACSGPFPLLSGREWGSGDVMAWDFFCDYG